MGPLIVLIFAIENLLTFNAQCQISFMRALLAIAIAITVINTIITIIITITISITITITIVTFLLFQQQQLSEPKCLQSQVVGSGLGAKE